MKTASLIITLLICQVCLAQKSYIQIEKIYPSKHTKGYGIRYTEEHYENGKQKARISINGIDDCHLFTNTYLQRGDTFITVNRWYIIKNNHRIPPYAINSSLIIMKNRKKTTVSFDTKDSLVQIYESKWSKYKPGDFPSSDYSDIFVFIKSPNYRNFLDTTLFETTTYFYVNNKLVKKNYSKNDTSFVYTHFIYEYNANGFPSRTIEINRRDTNWIETFYRDTLDSLVYSVFRWKDFENPNIIHKDTTTIRYEYGKTIRKIITQKNATEIEVYNKKGSLISIIKGNKTDIYKYDNKERLKIFNNQTHTYRRYPVNKKCMLPKKYP